MNLEINNETIKLCEIIFEEKRNKLIEGEMIVPDIKPDILSISNVDADVFLSKKELTNGRLLIEGIADVTALYVAEDQSASIKSINNVFSFSESFEIAELSSESIINTNVDIENIEYKVMNGRKIAIRIPITLNVIARNCKEYLIAKDVVDSKNIQMQKEEVEIRTLRDYQNQNVELNEIINLPDESAAISDVLKANLELKNIDYKISYNKILAKADAIIKIIYTSDSEIPSVEVYETSIPVMGYINSNNLEENSIIELKFNIKSFTLRPIYQDLKSRSFSVESEIEVISEVYYTRNVELISDIYAPDADLNLQTQNIFVKNNLISSNEEFELMQVLMIPELENIKILSIKAKPIITNKNILDGKIALEGNIEFNILYYNKQKRIIENKKLELPYQQVLKISELKSNMPVIIELKIKELEYRNADSTQLQMKVVLSATVLVEEEKNIQGITEIKVEDLKECKRPSITVYYVKPGDTLWNIAKRYRTTVDEIKEYNELKENTIYPNQALIIPKRNQKVSINL